MPRPQLLLIAVALLGVNVHAEAGERAKDHVKATAVATKSDADGKQIVTITLEIEKGFYIYANPLNHELLGGAELKTKVTAKEKVSSDINYPVGKTIGTVEKFDIYEGIVKIEAHIVRAKGDTSPLKIQVHYLPANGLTCFNPAALSLSVP